jgi:hypothetical protein
MPATDAAMPPIRQASSHGFSLAAFHETIPSRTTLTDETR